MRDLNIKKELQINHTSLSEAARHKGLVKLNMKDPDGSKDNYTCGGKSQCIGIVAKEHAWVGVSNC